MHYYHCGGIYYVDKNLSESAELRNSSLRGVACVVYLWAQERADIISYHNVILHIRT